MSISGARLLDHLREPQPRLAGAAVERGDDRDGDRLFGTRDVLRVLARTLRIVDGARSVGVVGDVRCERPRGRARPNRSGSGTLDLFLEERVQDDCRAAGVFEPFDRVDAIAER